MLSVCVFLFPLGLCIAAEEEPHPEITLIDYDGNEISPDSNVPYSPKNTCGECHDYDAITNLAILEALNGSKSVNTAEEIKTYLEAISKGTDRYGCRIANHTPVLVKGGMIYYMENNQLNKANMPTRDGGFKCCEPFDLSHNVVSGKDALGSKGCKDCHTSPSPFFNRKVLLDPFNRDGRPVYKEQWQILGYSRKRMKELTKERVIPPEA
jgi:hypothetical protein